MKRGFDSTQFKRKEPATKKKTKRVFAKPYRGNLAILEKKFFDVVSAADEPLPATGGPMGTTLGTPGLSLNAVDVGIKPFQMVGRKITIKSIEARFMLALEDTPSASNVYRLFLVLDKQFNGAQPTWTDIIRQSTAFGMRELDNQNRFQIIKEWNGNLDAQIINVMTSNSEPVKQYFHWYKKCNIDIEFAEQAGGNRTQTEIKSNNLSVWGASDSGVVNYQGTWRIRFTDA